MESSFVSKTISRTSTITLHAPQKEVFPLFGPMREKEWASGWEPRLLSGNAGLVEEHMLFRTPSHGHSEPDYTWLVSKYLPEQGVIEYTVFTPERVWWIAIRCREDPPYQTTRAEITCTYTGLSEKGNEINEEALRRMFAGNLQDWEEAINHYLKTGERMSFH